MKKLYILFLLAFCLKQSAFSQKNITDYYYTIDSLEAIGQPQAALKELDRLQIIAKKANNEALTIKNNIYRIKFLAYVQEDAIAKIVSSLQEEIKTARFPVQNVLQSLLAEIYGKYYQQNGYRISQRSDLNSNNPDFTYWNIQKLLKETLLLYQGSLSNKTLLQNTKIEALSDALTGDQSNRHLRPTVYDLLLHRALKFYLSSESVINKPVLPAVINNEAMFTQSAAFARIKIDTQLENHNYLKGLKLLQEATAFHLHADNAAAVADLELIKLNFLYKNVSFVTKDSLYINGLQQIAKRQDAGVVRADALSSLADYYRQKNELVETVRILEEIVQKYPEHIKAKDALKNIAGIKKEDFSAQFESFNLPGEAILGLLNYKNTTNITLNIYRLADADADKLIFKEALHNGRNKLTNVKAELLKLQPFRKQKLSLPEKTDHQQHQIEFKIDTLPTGNYFLLLEDAEKTDSLNFCISNFRVTNIAVLPAPYSQQQVLVLNRKTGEPIADARISVESYNRNTKKFVPLKDNGLTDKKGGFIINEDNNSSYQNYNFKVIQGADTLRIDNIYIRETVNNAKKNNIHYTTTIFTDREIYRPGQTIYFKGISFEKSGKESKLSVNYPVRVSIKSKANKEIGSFDLTTNEFGSFTDTFIISKDILPGELRFSVNNSFSKTLRVEEYKRPTFEITLAPEKDNYSLNDSVIFKGKVTTYAGFTVQNAKLGYEINRRLNYIKSVKGINYKNQEVTKDTLTTDENGEFFIRFKAAPYTDIELREQKITYSVNVSVTDRGGETQSKSNYTLVGQNNLDIVLNTKDVISKSDTSAIKIFLRSLNYKPVNGLIDAEIFAVEQPENYTRNRLWSTNKTESLISAEDFKKQFPSYSYENNKIIENAKRLKLIENFSFKDTASQFNLYHQDLKRQKTGFYELKIKALTVTGDTASVSKYFYFVNNPESSLRPQDWLIAEKTNIAGNEKARFILTRPNSSVLVDVYENGTLISSERVNVGKSPKIIEFPLKDKKQLNVDFLMVYDNRAYQKTHEISRIVKTDNLNIQLLSFRDKMQPGDKEQIKLRISNNSKAAMSEVLATLYDASLDALAKPVDWQVDFNRSASPYKRNYSVRWNLYQFNQVVNSRKNRNNYYNPLLIKRNYETLNLNGYNYYGGHNRMFSSYSNYLKAVQINPYQDSLIKIQYNLNASKVKEGFNFSGRTIDSRTGYGIAGVIVSLKGTQINTVSNSFGYFKIKVPQNSVLLFDYKGIRKWQVNTGQAESYQTITINPFDEITYDSVFKSDLTGSVAGVGDSQLNEVSVIGYGSSKADIMIRGNSSLGEYTVQETDKIFTNVDLGYQSIRKNFNETAFFYPQLKTDETGAVNIDFTLPESLTTWRFKAFAHDKNLNSILLEKEIMAQKTLMLSPNMPRFVRAGDTVKLSIRLFNMGSTPLKAKLHTSFFNGVDMSPLNIQLLGGETNFTLKPNSSETAIIEIAVPENIEALTYRFMVTSDSYADGEENTIPVLSNKILLTEAMPVFIKSGENKTFTFDKLLGNKSTTLQHKALTFEFTANSAWLVVEALPYLGEVKFDYAEAIFSAWYANNLSAYILEKNPTIKKIFGQWRNTNTEALLSNLEKNQELKSLLIEETPWLKQAENETERKRRIALLFDLNQLEYQQNINIEKLKKLQLPDGSFPWINELRTDRFISQHILAGLGQLNRLKILEKNIEANAISQKLLDFIDDQLGEINETKYLNIHAWYARSYFNTNISDGLKPAWLQYVKQVKAQWLSYNIYQQALVSLTLHRNGEKELSALIRNSIADRAIRSEEMGAYWPKSNWGCFWYELPVETHCLLIELFEETAPQSKLIADMKLWLLRQKQTNNWRSTKATAAACYVLLNQPAELSLSTLPQIKIGNKELSVLKPELDNEAGTGYIKTSWLKDEIKSEFGKVEISKVNKPSWGALYWQYTEKSDKITASANGLSISRKYYLKNKGQQNSPYNEVDENHIPKVGDLLKVIINLKSDRNFEYIHLKDLRPAGTEPVVTNSAYKFQDGLYYYQVNKDASTNFFINYLPKGTYVFEYELRVAQAGVFHTGITTIESMYAPEYRSNSKGEMMRVE